MARKKNSDQQDASGPRYSLFLSFQSGMQTLVEELNRQIPEDSIFTGTKVNQVELQPEKIDGWWTLTRINILRLTLSV